MRLAAVCALTLGLSASAQSAPLEGDDRTFVDHVAKSSLVEKSLSRVIQVSSSDPGFKSCARQFEQDQELLDEELEVIARRHAFSLPARPNLEDQNVIAEITALRGKQMEAAFKTKMIKDHERDLALFRHIADHANTADLRSFATRAIPVLEGHLKLARELVPGRSLLYGAAEPVYRPFR